MKKSEARAKKLKKLEAESLFSNLLSDSERKHLHSDEGAFDTSEEVPIFIQSSADDQLDYKDFLESLKRYAIKFCLLTLGIPYTKAI